MSATPDRDAVAALGLFDSAWYLARYEDVAGAGVDPLRHYLDYGMHEDRWPNRYFDPAWYRDTPLHYITEGEKSGRRPHPLFDPVWYRRAYAIPGQCLALAHYIANRFSGRFVPSPDLFAVPLVSPYRDDPASGIDPVEHYLDDMQATGQDPTPDRAVLRASGLIDDNYYLINGSDVLDASLDPADHYCRWGWREYRKPNIYFDPEWYEHTNPDVTRLRINPLVHYVLAGEPAGRRPVPYFDPAWYRAEYRVPPKQGALRHYLANRRKQRFSPTPLFDVHWYVARFGEAFGPTRDPFAHYLQAGMTQDIDPSRRFDAANYRRTHLLPPALGFTKASRPEQHHPLVHHLRAEYEYQSGR
jgi:hypothetical protein